MICRHPGLSSRLVLVLVAAASASLMVTGCSDQPAAAEDAASEAHVDLHDDEDPGLPAPNDDPALGGDIDEDTGDLEEEDARASGDSADEIDLGTTTQALSRIGSPVPGKGVTYAYGVRNPRYAAGFHTGQDHAAPVGRRVVAVRSGRIRWSNNFGGAYGKWIGLDADNGRTYVYCHLSRRLVGAGTRVGAGRLIGRVGATGNVTGPHLHFEDHPRGPFVYAQVRKPSW